MALPTPYGGGPYGSGPYGGEAPSFPWPLGIPIGRSSRGASLQVSTDGGVTWIAVAQLRTITPSGKRTEILDQTNLSTAGTAKVKLAVQVDAGNVAYDGVLFPTDFGLNLLSSLQDALTLATFRIVLPVDAVQIYLGTLAVSSGLRGPAWAAGFQFNAGYEIIDPSGHVQQAQAAFTSGSSAPAWNDTGGFCNDGTQLNAWLDLGLPGGICPTDLELISPASDLVDQLADLPNNPRLAVVRSCPTPSFNGGPFEILEFGSLNGSSTNFSLLYAQAGMLGEAFSGALVDIYRLASPTIHSFQGFVVEHVPVKIAIGKLCTFAGKIEISGPISTVLGDAWSSSGAGSGAGSSGGGPDLGGETGWLAPVWTTYSISDTVPLTAEAIKAIGGSVGITLELTAGATYYIVKYDSGPGAITVTYGGVTIYELLDQYQFVLLSWDGAEFLQIGGN